MSRRDREGGDLSIEYVFLTLVVFLVFALVITFARMAEVNGVLDSGTRDAARIASEADSYDQAEQLATQTVLAAIRGKSTMCANTLKVTVEGTFAPPSPTAPPTATAPPQPPTAADIQTITVLASCDYPYDVGLPIPGSPSLHVRSQFSAVIDPNRSL